MPGPWISSDAVLRKVADVLKKDVGDLPAYWTALADNANEWAANTITAVLLGRGYTAAQIAGWDARAGYNRRLALYWALVEGGGLGDYEDKWVERLKFEKEELQNLAIVVNDEVVTPGASGDYGVAGGLIDDTDYRFNMDTEF